MKLHEEQEEIPDHEACQMPQELRWPEFRTKKHYEEVNKMFTTQRLINSPSIAGNSTLTELALGVVWGEMTQEKAELIVAGLMTFDKYKMESKDSVNDNN